MSDSPNPKKKKKRKQQAPSKAILIVMIAVSVVVFGVLAYVLMLATQDFSAKQAAISAEAAWRSALRAKNDKDADLTKSELEKIPLTGNPSHSSSAAEKNDKGITTIDTYIWKGKFRTYSIQISYGMGNDPTVEFIDPIK